jgi:hypothetical protein
MAIEQAAYKIILKEGDFELRQYEPMTVAVTQESDLKGGNGFNTLFEYISGNNQTSTKIAMTAPVLNSLDQKQLSIAFVMPHHYDTGTLPAPLNNEIQLKEIPERMVAALIFSGSINSEKITLKKNELSEWLKGKQISVTGLFQLARYNPPFIPGFIKHNELLVEVNLDI